MPPENNRSPYLVYALIVLLLGIAFLTAGIFTSSWFEKKDQPNVEIQQEITPAQVEGESVVVKRVVDGDTIELEDSRKVRYIGIDTPETVDPRRGVGCFGKEASDFNKKLVEGKKVMLEKDVSETDKFGRLLRYVYLKDDTNLFVNEYLVKEGYAKVDTFPPDVKFSEVFLEAERLARENKKGLWGECETK